MALEIREDRRGFEEVRMDRRSQGFGKLRVVG
jgi:hypothetical protein